MKKMGKMKKKNRYDTSYTQNRELSWLKFNERVLEQARDASTPLFERLKFAAIFTNNLDEFFMVRVGSLYDLSLLKDGQFDNKSIMTPSEQLDVIFPTVAKLYKARDKVVGEIEKKLREYGISHVNIRKAGPERMQFLESYFMHYILPVLSPQVIDFQHPFPHLVNKSLSIAVMLKHGKKKMLGLVPVPASLPKVVYLPGSKIHYVLAEKIILEFVYKIFTMYSIIDKAVICVTRNADISPEDEAPDLEEDYLQHMKKILKKRLRLAPVRLEMEYSGDSLITEYLRERLKIKETQVYITKVPINLSYVYSLAERFTEEQKAILTYEPFMPAAVPELIGQKSIIQYLLKQDLLVTYPYQQFETFLQLIKEAAYDPHVISIKITIYRMGSSKSKLMNYLIAAAENGKDVTVLLELRARFDEQNNINWAESLEEAGCKILYGLERYKVHSKICLITRCDKDEVQYITQVGTGNYNAQTAKIYTDLSLMTSHPAIGSDAAAFFTNMAIANLNGNYSTLLVAPKRLKEALLDFIDAEIAKAKDDKPAEIIMKMNSLTDRDLIDRLAAASQAGVKIRLIIRGICCLVPQIPKKTENITVISIIGRFLEHSRIFCFGSGQECKIYISSADLMTRNTENRVEIACPVFDLNLQKKILHALKIMWLDTVKGRELQSNQKYKKRENEKEAKIDSQNYFLQEYAATVKGDLES